MKTSRCLHEAIQRHIVCSDKRRLDGYFLRRLTSDSSKISSDVPNKTTSTNGIAEKEASSSMLSRIKSYAYESAHQSINQIKQKATINLSRTANTLKESITDVAQSNKERIKKESTRHISDAQQSINTLKERVKNSASTSLENAKNNVNATLAETSRERIKNELSDRIYLPFKKTLIESNKSVSNKAEQSTIIQSASAANIATKVLAETTAQAATNVTSTVKESVSKATRWLWWWGLAAVGVYGMSTTLTKEGVKLLKDVFKSSNSESSAAGGNDDAVASAVADANNLNENKVYNQELTKTSWFSSIKKFFASNRKTDN